MPTLSGCCKIIIKNHNLSIILILSFLLVSYLQRRIKCVFKNCGYSGALGMTPKSARGPPHPLPRAGGGYQSCLTTDIGFGNTCQIKKVTARGPEWLEPHI